MKIVTITFIKIENRGAGPAAVFKDCFGTEFCLIQDSLEARIRNLKNEDFDTSVEEIALLQMKKEK